MDSRTFWITFGPLLVINTIFLSSIAIFPFFYPKMEKVDFVADRHASKFLGKWIRYWWVWITTPIFKVLKALGLTPNQVSFIGTFLGFVSAAVFAFADQWIGLASLSLGGWIMVVGASFDFMDGRLARETNQQSLSGAFFDSVMDRVSECAVFAGLAWYYHSSWVFWVIMLAYSGSMLTSYSKCRGDKMGVNYDGGTMQRPERIVYTGVGGILSPLFAYLILKFDPTIFPDLKTAADSIYVLPLAIVGVMSTYTTYDRIRSIMRLLDAKEGKVR